MSAILSSLVGPVTGLLDKFIEDKDQKNASPRNSNHVRATRSRACKGTARSKQGRSCERVCSLADGALPWMDLLYCFTR